MYKNKTITILFIIFIILSLIYIFYSSIIGRGIFLDGLRWCSLILEKLSLGFWNFEGLEVRTRDFIILIEQLPVNIAYKIGIHSKEFLKFMYCIPLFLFPFLVTIWNIKLAERTKRYDIALAALLIYGVFILPGIGYSVVEAFLAVPVIFLLHHYFAADIDYTKKDIFITAILAVILFAASEIVIFTGAVTFFLSLYYFKKIQDKKKRTVKLAIGILQLAAAFELALRNFIFTDNMQGETNSFFGELLNIDINTLINGQPLFLIITVPLMGFFLFYKKRLHFIQVIILALVYLFILISMLLNARETLNNFLFIHLRVLLYLAVPVIFFIFYIQEFFEKFIPPKCIYNLFAVILICSIANTCIQLYYCMETHKRIKHFAEIISGTSKNILKQDEDLNEIYGGDNFFFIRLFPMDAYLLFTKEYEKDKIIIPGYETKDGYVKINKENNYLISNYGNYGEVWIKLKTGFWDLTKAAEKYQNSPD